MLNPILRKELSNDEYRRYAKQIIMKEINKQGQKKLKKARILCIGLGGLNSPTLLYLAACGVGHLGLVDSDTIEISNLQRQILYRTEEIKKRKSLAAFHTLKSLNPNIKIHSYNYYLTKDNIKNIISKYDIVMDGTDNFKTRYIISQYCYSLHRIHIYGAIDKFNGQVSVFNYKNGQHYYSLYKNIKNIEFNKCDNSGLINTLAGIIGTLQATEAIKIIVGLGDIMSEYLIVFNILQSSLHKIKIKKYSIKQKNTINIIKKKKRRYLSLIDSYKNETLLIDVRTASEFQVNHIQRSINIPLCIIKKEKYINFLLKINHKKIILYCDNENRSYIASQILHKYKIENYILQGGLNSIRKERDSNPR